MKWLISCFLLSLLLSVHTISFSRDLHFDGCKISEQKPSDSRNVTFTNRATDELRIENPSIKIFCNENEFMSFDTSKISIKDIDFHKNMLIGLFWGFQGTSCAMGVHPVDQIKDIYIKDGLLTIEINKLYLGLCTAISLPLQLIEVQRTEKILVITSDERAFHETKKKNDIFEIMINGVIID